MEGDDRLWSFAKYLEQWSYRHFDHHRRSKARIEQLEKTVDELMTKCAILESLMVEKVNANAKVKKKHRKRLWGTRRRRANAADVNVDQE